MAKTLIAYGTRYGATAEVAAEIARIFKEKYGLSAELVDLTLQKVKDTSPFQNIVIGSGIKNGRWVARAQKFLKNNFKEKKLAIFVCSRRAGEPDLYNEAYKKYIEKVLAKYPKIKPVASEAFGGRKPLKNNQFYENRDWNKIREWAEKIGEIFSSSHLEE